MRIEKVGLGYAICADSTLSGTALQVLQLTGEVPLIIADPPYGNVLPAKWDRYNSTDENFAEWMRDWTANWARCLATNAAFYVWGGIGTPGFRPFFHYLASIEKDPRFQLQIANLITWKKKRAYGIQHNYLFTREECVYLFNGSDIKKPRCFNVPLLEEKRGYAGYNKKYPAKSEQYRRSNVWADITEVMRGKVHDAQKAARVMEIPIEVHTHPGEWVIDPFAGSGATGIAAMKLGRRFVVIENDPQIFEEMLERLRVNAAGGGVGSDHEAQATQQGDHDTGSRTGQQADHRSTGDGEAGRES